MSKVIAIALLTALMLLPNPGIGMSTPSTPPNGPMKVTVLFSGLMVFNENPVTGAYEVGILDAHHSEGHQFCVRQLDTVCRQPPPPRVKIKTKNSNKAIEPLPWLPTGTKWKLTVKPDPNEMPYGTGLNGKRRPDIDGKQHDFEWIVTLDGGEFHNKPLPLKSGQFKPIIQLPKVRLFAKYKSPDFVRWQGKKPSTPAAFGFVAETIGFTVILRKKGDELILEDEDTGTIIIRQSYVAPTDVSDSETIYISNARYPKQQKSDFRMYYELFSTAIPEREQYDFDVKENKHPCGPQQPTPCEPLNPLPKPPPVKELPTASELLKGRQPRQARYKTCCDLVCTPIRLNTGGSLLPQP